MAALPSFLSLPLFFQCSLMLKPLRALLVVLLLVIPAAAAAQSDPPADPVLGNARMLVEIGVYDQALAILRPLAAAEHPDAVNVLFLIGLAATGAALAREEDSPAREELLDEAIAAFHAILIERPGLVRVRLELARAFFLKGEDDLARDHFERVLAGRPAPPVVINIQRFLAVMRARKRWSFRVGAALAPDSNIGAASEADIIYIYGLPFRRDADAGARSGIGVVVWGGAEYQHPLGERWRLRAGGDLARREYSGGDFDQTFAAIHLGPRWLIDPATEASFLATAERRWAAGAPQSYALGPRLEARHRITRRLTAEANLSWQERTYRISDYLDGPVMSLSAGAGWVVTPTVRLDATLGYSRERPEAHVWRNATRWARAGVSVALPEGFTVGGGGELRLTDFRGVWYPFVIDGSAREDRTRIFRVTVLNRSLTVFGFSPQLVLVNEARTSNAQLYDYRRNRAELRVQRLF